MQQSEKKLDQLNNEINQSKRLIRIKGVIRLSGLSKSYIYQLCSNNKFPRSVQLVSGGSSVAWVEAEILNWIDERIQERDREIKTNG